VSRVPVAQHSPTARWFIAAALAGTLLLCAPAVCSADGAAATAGVSNGAAVATLSNLHSLSRWAYPQAESAVHQEPSAGSRSVARTRFLTPDGQAQVYLALRSYTVEKATWILVSVPGRPNGVAGWVPASALGEMHVTREYLRVNRETLRAVLYREGRPVWTAPVGVGRPAFPTPAGHFYVTEELTPLADPFYGPYAIGTSAYAPTLSDWPGGGVVGLHGTDEPQLIPGRPSHGCIRLRNSDVASLWRLIAIGTPIEIV
jgi:lipoprotein-anchoring transpeptidase ErfK/SrfK